MGTKQDEIWDVAYTQALLIWLTQHGYTPNTIPPTTRWIVMDLAREHAMFMADLALEGWLNAKAQNTSHKSGSTVHLLFDRDSTQVLDDLQRFTGTTAGEVVRNAIATYEWLRQRLHEGESITITRQMCPHLAPKPAARPRLTLV